jgi:membrane protease YdiL (CAAX protease family)
VSELDETARLDRWGPPTVMVAWLAGAALSRVAGMWAGIGATAVTLAVALLVLDGRRLVGLLAPSRGPVAYGALVGAFMTLATYALYPLVSDFSAPFATDVAHLYARLGGDARTGRALLLVPIVVAEELVWRGFVQSALQRRYGARASVLLATVLYALAHAPVGSALLVVVALACGLVWSALRATTSSLIAPLLAHLLWDLVVLFVVPVARPG